MQKLRQSFHRLHHYSRTKEKRVTWSVLPAGSPARTSCPATAAPTPESSHTSASSARRSLPAAITCPNTSKSTAFREAAGQAALQTDCRELPSRRWQTAVAWVGGAAKRHSVTLLANKKQNPEDQKTYVHSTVIIYWVVKMKKEKRSRLGAAEETKLLLDTNALMGWKKLLPFLYFLFLFLVHEIFQLNFNWTGRFICYSEYFYTLRCALYFVVHWSPEPYTNKIKYDQRGLLLI